MEFGRRSVLLIVIFAALGPAGLAANKEPPIGKPAPDFHVTTFDGTKLSLADFSPRVALRKVRRADTRQSE